MSEPVSEDWERKFIEEGGMSVEEFNRTVDRVEQARLTMGVFEHVALMSNLQTDVKQIRAKKIQERIASEKKKEKEEIAVRKTYTRWAVIYDNGESGRRFMELEVDEGSNANFLTQGMAHDRRFRVQPLGSRPFRGESINGDVECYEYAKVTIYGGNENEPYHIEADFYILPANAPPNDPRIDKPIVGRKFLKEAGHLLLTEDPRAPVRTTKMGKETELMKEQRKQQAASVEAYQANASRARDAPRKNKDDIDKKAQDRGSASRTGDKQGS